VHREEGLMSPRLRRAQLLDPRLALDADLHSAFLAGLDGLGESETRQAGLAEAGLATCC
jgi:hypothetical protein